MVGSGARVEGSIVMTGALVGADAVVRDSVLGNGARIAPGVLVDEAVVGDRAQVSEGNELAAGARVWPDVALPPSAIRFSSDEPQA